MGRLGNGWALTKLCFRVLRKDKELLLLPLISGVITIAIWLSYFGYVIAFNIFDKTGTMLYLSIAMGFIFYLLSNFVVIFFNAAIVGAAMIRLNGGNPTVKDGIRVASSRIKEIFMWAIFAATVSMILKAISERGALGRIVAGLMGIAWSIATYFAIPVIIYEGLTPWQAVKRSASILGKTWGETFISSFGIGGIFFLLYLVGLVPLVLGFMNGTLLILIVCILIAVIYWVFIGILQTAAQGVLLAALYRYAVTGKISEDFEGVVPPPANNVQSQGYSNMF